MQSSTATSAIQKAAKGNEQSFTDLQVLNEMWSKLSRPLDDVKNKMNEMARGKREKNGRQVAASGSSTLPPPPPTFRFFSEEEWSKKKAQKMHFFLFSGKKNAKSRRNVLGTRSLSSPTKQSSRLPSFGYWSARSPPASPPFFSFFLNSLYSFNLIVNFIQFQLVSLEFFDWFLVWVTTFSTTVLLCIVSSFICNLNHLCLIQFIDLIYLQLDRILHPVPTCFTGIV